MTVIYGLVFETRGVAALLTMKTHALRRRQRSRECGPMTSSAPCIETSLASPDGEP